MYLGLCAYKQARALYVLLIIVRTMCMPFFDCNIIVCIEKHKIYVLYSMAHGTVLIFCSSVQRIAT